MSPKLIDDSLFQYPGLPPREEVEKLQPDLNGLVFQLASHVPEFGVWTEDFEDPGKGETYELIAQPTKRAVRQILGLFYANIDKQERYTDRTIKKNLAALQISVMSRIAQVDESKTWLDLRRRHDEAEAGRVHAERDAVLNGDKNLYYPRITRKPFISSTTEAFDGSARNLAKTLQKIMSDPTNCYEIKDEHIAASEEGIQGLILDPRYITWRQLENLGLAPDGIFSPLRQMEIKAEKIPGIKHEFLNLRPIGEWDPRDRFGRYRVYASPFGEILGTTHVKSGRPTIYKASLLDAVRRKTHIETGYKPETRQLVRFLEILERIDKKIAGNWQRVKDSGELQEAKDQLMKIVEEMDNVRNEDKVAARDLLEESMTLESTFVRNIPEKDGEPARKEVTIRLNPGAKRAQINKAARSLRNRLRKSIPHISRYNTSDGVIIDQELAVHENIPFAALLDYINQRDKGRTSADQLKLSPKQQKMVEERLFDYREKFLPQSRRKKFFEPWNSFCYCVIKGLDQAICTVRNSESRVADLKDDLQRLSNTLVLQNLWKQWESFYDLHLGNDRMPYFVKLARDLKSLKGKSANLIGLQDDLAVAFSTYDQKIDEMLPLCELGVLAYKENNEKHMNGVRKELKRQMKSVADVAEIINPKKPVSGKSLTETPSLSEEPECEEPLPPEAFENPATGDFHDSEIPPTEPAKVVTKIPPTLPSARFEIKEKA